jgi:hypothetical protein
MPDSDSPWLRHHRQRWLRHDAHLWIRPDAARFFAPGTDPAIIDPTLPRKADAAQAAAFEAELAAKVAAGYRLNAVLREEVAELRAELKRRRAEEAKYSPGQPRVPAGNPRGGQWSNRNEGGAGSGSFGTADGGASEGTDGAEDVGGSNGSENSDSGAITDARAISDADPESIKPGEQYAQAAGRRSGTSVRINGQIVEVSPGQEAELQGVQARAEGAITRVRELDPNWKPTPSAYESVDGLIRKYRADAQQAQDRASELGRMGIGLGRLRESRSQHADPNVTLRRRNAVRSIVSGATRGARRAGQLIREPSLETLSLTTNIQVQ